MKNVFLFLVFLCSGLAQAQYNSCNESRDQFDSSSRCESRFRYCQYDSRSRCYVPANNPSRCDERRDQFDSQYTCQSRTGKSCSYENGCYVPARSRCNENNNQFDSQNTCEARTRLPCVNSNGCYVPDQRRPTCDANFKEYDTLARCERMHSQGCDYEQSSNCYVPKKVIEPPRCQPSMPTSVCTSGSREEYGTGWADQHDCQRKWDETYGRPANLSCYQKSNCCWGLH